VSLAIEELRSVLELLVSDEVVPLLVEGDEVEAVALEELGCCEVVSEEYVEPAPVEPVVPLLAVLLAVESLDAVEPVEPVEPYVLPVLVLGLVDAWLEELRLSDEEAPVEAVELPRVELLVVSCVF
jgi:hypothetical protein